jgi:hypothetical protein
MKLTDKKSHRRGWFRFSGSDTVFVFVHGLFSNSDKCWKSKDGVFWPSLILEDRRYNNPDIFLAEFYTSPLSNEYGIKDCAKEVFDLLGRVDESFNPAPLDGSNIVFITHSTGGIVVRYMIEAYREKFVGKKIGLCLYASPSYGSGLARIFGVISRFFGNRLAMELSWGGAVLADLDSRFKEMVGSGGLDIHGMEAYEGKAPFGVPFLPVRVVSQGSAARYFSRHRLIPNSDHSSIVKPDSISHPSHNALFDFLSAGGLLSSKGKGALISSASLFDRYKEEFEPFYIERREDLDLEHLVSAYSIWLCGRSGLGKTAAISRVLIKRGACMRYVSLGGVSGDSPLQIIRALCSDLSDGDFFEGATLQECVSWIRDWVEGLCKNDEFYLFVEEIPISEQGAFIEFAEYIYRLISEIRDVARFRIILSSIYSPPSKVPESLLKVSERMKIVYWSPWSVDDISRLISVIEGDIGPFLVTPRAAESFDGNPRLVKNYYRDQLVLGAGGAE